VLFDLEAGTATELAEILRGADAVVFAAGAGGGSGAARKDTMDRGGAVLLAVLDTPATTGQTFEVVSGDTEIAEAVTTSSRE